MSKQVQDSPYTPIEVGERYEGHCEIIDSVNKDIIILLYANNLDDMNDDEILIVVYENHWDDIQEYFDELAHDQG